jgi:hypothetical protein
MGAAEAPALAAPAAVAELERRVMAAVKASEARGDPPLLRAVEVARLVAGEGAGAGLPSAELAGILVSNLCFAHNSPSLWKLLDQAMSSRLLCPLHVLALLTARYRPRVPFRAHFLMETRVITLSRAGFAGWCPSGERSQRRTGCTWSCSRATSRPLPCLSRQGLIVTSKNSAM